MHTKNIYTLVISSYSLVTNMKMQGKNLEHIFLWYSFSQLNFLHQRISNVSETDEVQMLFAGSLWATCKHRTFFVPTYVEILLEEHIINNYV